MKFALPAVCAALVAVAGCSRVPTPDGVTILAQSQGAIGGRLLGAEKTVAYSVRESNVISVPWPLAPTTVDGPGRLYGRPVSTILQHTEYGTDQWRYDTLQSDGTPAGTGIVKVRNGDTGWTYVAGARRVQFLTFPKKEVGIRNWLVILLANYAVEDVRPDTIAGVPAWFVEVRPKSSGRPMRRLWVDRERYLPLRNELWSPDGRLLSVTQVLEPPRLIPASDLSALRPPSGPCVSVVLWDQEYRLPPATISATLGYPLAPPRWIPDGFVQTGVYLSIRPDASGASARWEYTDGIATLNVTQTKVSGGTSRGDAASAEGDFRGPVVSVQHGAYRFNVQGNLPRTDLRRIADSMSPISR